MTYEETLDYLYTQRPAFERQGASGYKPGLATARALDQWLGMPHRRYACVHVAGTNGKGSVSHLLAAILQQSGYRVGLFTSPHFVDFCERIRVDGMCITHTEVIEWVERFRNDFQPPEGMAEPSFFEMTTAMALDWFERRDVDIAVIEVGMGGRLDSTNIITPILSVITNISLDHTEFLGDTVEQIAAEKAGIIKAGVPVVVGQAEGGVRDVLAAKAAECGSQITFVADQWPLTDVGPFGSGWTLDTVGYGRVHCELGGDYQVQNAATVLAALAPIERAGFVLPVSSVQRAFAGVSKLTGLRGRWTRLGEHPAVIVDSAHNVAGITAAMRQLSREPREQLHMVVGFMADKDVEHILPLLPRNATYHFTQASTPRAMKAARLQEMAAVHGLHGHCHDSVGEALECARNQAGNDDLIYVGGSMYVLAELFTIIDKTP